MKATKEKNKREKEKEARKNRPASSFFLKQSSASKGDAITEMTAAVTRDDRGAAAPRGGSIAEATMAGTGDDRDSNRETAAPPGEAAIGEDVVTITNARPQAITPNDTSADFDLDE